ALYSSAASLATWRTTASRSLSNFFCLSALGSTLAGSAAPAHREAGGKPADAASTSNKECVVSAPKVTLRWDMCCSPGSGGLVLPANRGEGNRCRLPHRGRRAAPPPPILTASRAHTKENERGSSALRGDAPNLPARQPDASKIRRLWSKRTEQGISG